MKEQKSPLVFTLIVWVIWLAITVGGQKLQAGSTTDLSSMVSSGIDYAVTAAAAFLLIVVWYKKWWHEVALKWVDDSRTLRLLWLPALLILIMIVIGVTSGATMNVLLIVLINTLIVGVSEELMMRGVLFHGFSFKRSAVATVIITALLFGAMHGLNGFLTGEFGAAAGQAVLAVGMGFWAGALRVRLNSIIPLMILHGLWDFSLFAMGQGEVKITQFLPMVFAVILFIYGLWLLRGIKREETAVAVAT